MLEAQRKIMMFDLNLEYQGNWPSVDAQTNWLINRRMNEFEYLFANALERIFILDYKDDLLSLICYRMLKNLQSICKFDFQIFLTGKARHTKKYVKKEKRISSFKLARLVKNNQCVIVQPVNPLYNVMGLKQNYKDFPCKLWTPIAMFTPEQLKTAQIFYHIGYLKKDKVQLDSKEIEAFNSFLTGENNEWCKDYTFKYTHNIGIVKLTGKVEEDSGLLSNVEDYDGLVFYFYEGEEEPLILRQSEFSLYVKNKANIPTDDNINNMDVPYYIYHYFATPRIDFFGDWDYDNRKYELLGEI